MFIDGIATKPVWWEGNDQYGTWILQAYRSKVWGTTLMRMLRTRIEFSIRTPCMNPLIHPHISPVMADSSVLGCGLSSSKTGDDTTISMNGFELDISRRQREQALGYWNIEHNLLLRRVRSHAQFVSWRMNNCFIQLSQFGGKLEHY